MPRANIAPKLDDPAWETLWTALEETGVILAWHITVFFGKPGARSAGKAASMFENTKFFMANFLEPFVDLGALGAGDIGLHFPPSDPRWRGAPSHLFLAHARSLVAAEQGHIPPVVVTLIHGSPAIPPEMAHSRSAACGR